MSPRLIFDIETVGVEFDSLDEKSKETLLRFAESPEEIEAVKEGLGFSPLTGEVVAIGILNPDTEKGAVYFNSQNQHPDTIAEGDAQYIPCASEKEILNNFWDVASHYDQFVTFNGRTFDCPYILVRSAVLKVKPTRNLMPNRYYDEHIDLLDRLTFFGAVRRKGNLHMWCRAFGIESPKSKGITGDDVARLFKDKKSLDIAKYCFDDLKATKTLYEYWNKYINIK
ncbi:MAG: ribonuclease H-like domain-containing protein [Candidatus Yanofskybacteria bacterium]|nr:ribonuclease H-like domain-containing protein [Candidatus Yanofskybacteria bacterium]